MPCSGPPLLDVYMHQRGLAHLQDVQKTSVLHQLRVDVVQLGHTDCRCLPHIGVIILS